MCWLLLAAFVKVLQDREELRLELVTLEAEMEANKFNKVRNL